jgi:signal transduction histidine kinase
MTERLRFSPDILSRLGEELVPDIDQGIVELVKNAYDADATTCRISLTDATTRNAGVIVSDDGSGMTAEDIRHGWLIIGRSAKRRKSLTPRFKRVPVGDKGLGRLAALRLGRRVKLTTRPLSEPGVEYHVEIDWDEYQHAEVVEDVTFDIRRSRSRRPHGTEIEVAPITAGLSRSIIKKLARSLLLLSDPFGLDEQVGRPVPRKGRGGSAVDLGFKAELLTAEYADLQAKVAQSYFSDAEYRIRATLDGTGHADFRILDWKGDTLHESQPARPYQAPPFEFDLWVFILDAKSFSTRSSTMNEVKSWLGQVGGVHVYEDGIRVPPYGGPGDDWLGLNLRRVRSPEMRPSTNTAIGRIKLSNVSRSLVQKTDRNGYIENTAFAELRRCCAEVLEWAARVKLRERDIRRRAEKVAAQTQTERANARLERVLSKSVRVTERGEVKDAIARYVKEAERETQVLREELQLYRSLATAGMTTSVFAHEIGRPLALIDTGIEALRHLIPAEKQQSADKRIKRISEAKIRLNSFVSIPLTLLAKRKRRSGRTNVNHCIANLLLLLEPIMDYFLVSVEADFTNEYAEINGSEALIDGICLNLIMNSLNAFQRDSFHQPHRRLRIATSYDGSQIDIMVEDNAGGIKDIELDDVWLPGVTTTPEGTGFGLTIVRDSVNDLGGSVAATALTEFGGALFVVTLPPMRLLI